MDVEDISAHPGHGNADIDLIPVNQALQDMVMAHTGIGQFSPVGKHIEQVVEILLTAFAGLGCKAFTLVIVLHRFLQPNRVDLAFLLVDGVRLGYKTPDSRHLLGDGLPIILRNQYTFLEIGSFEVPPGGVDENLRNLSFAEISSVGYADM